MAKVIGDLLPLAIGVAISPIPIIAVILMLLSPRAGSTSLAFLVGWLVGIILGVAVFTALSSILPASDPSQAKPIGGVIKLVLGILLVLLAFRQFQQRPGPDAEPTMPKWMSAIDSMKPPQALAIGFLLSALNPKNLIMAIAAGTTVGTAALSGGDTVLVIAIFTVLAASTVGGPVLAYLVASRAMASPLRSLRGWLLHNNAAVMSVVLLVIGVAVIGKGIGSF